VVKQGGCIAVAFALLAFGLSAAHAQGVPQTQVKLVASQPVYDYYESEDGVQFTLTNGTSQTLTMSSSEPWTIHKDNQLVYFPTPYSSQGQIDPGQSKIWVWYMEDANGDAVPAGSYTIKVGPLSLGNVQFTRSVTVALTPTGKIAGSSSFPLAVGNEWNFVAGPAASFFGGPGIYSSTKVAKKSGAWYWIKDLVGKDRWAQLSGGFYPTLSVMAMVGGDGNKSVPFFHFNWPPGYSYTVQAAPLTGVTLKMGSKHDTLQTPVGTFENCYRLDVQYPFMVFIGIRYKSFWFAPGVGLVGYNKSTLDGLLTFRLESAKIKGSNGKFYSLNANQ